MLKVVFQFCAGDFSLNDSPQLGRPVEVDRHQIETLTENNQHSTTQETLKICKAIKLLVKMKNMSFILRKKPYRLFGQPNKSDHITPQCKTLQRVPTN